MGVKKNEESRVPTDGEEASSERLGDARANPRPGYVIVAPDDLRVMELDADGETFVLFEWASAPVFLDDGLTDAERDVVTGILRGESNGAIANRRGTHLRTVANQVARIFRKLGVSSRSELIARVTRPDRAR